MSRYKDAEGLEPPRPSACSRFLRYTWKTITCIFSHIFLVSLVVSYCILGAKTFESLEKNHEVEVKKNISSIRKRIMDKIYTSVESSLVLREDEMVPLISTYLKEFEGNILKAMNKDGWDGEEDLNKVQWTFAGALFYSIIVITTIGYGHIAPKTTWGKVVTIFYAILGIPLMLLCLSNIGDVMATSFRFIYWRVCCYVCTKKPKKSSRRGRQRTGTIRMSGRGSNRSKQSLRRSVRNSTRSADSGFDYGEVNTMSHSDSELRAHEDLPPMYRRGTSLPRMKPKSLEVPSGGGTQKANFSRVQLRGGSLDRRRVPKIWDPTLDVNNFQDAPVLCNKYAIEGADVEANHVDGDVAVNRRSYERPKMSSTGRRAASMPRTQNFLELPGQSSLMKSEEDLRIRKTEVFKRPSPSKLSPSPRIMSPMGFGGSRTHYLEEESDCEFYEDDVSFESSRTSRIRPVPIWLCVFLVVSYIFAGAFLFTAWENWEYLDSAYFCFITLTTIGFGDFVPAKRVTENAEMSIALCSLYLLFGISLLAMSFNLVQEEVIANVKSVAKTLGIIKRDDLEEDDD